MDWLTGNFYFVDDVDDRIFVCDKNGQTCVTLLDQELYNPKGIALDPTVGSVLCLPHTPTRIHDLYVPFLSPSSSESCSRDSLRSQPSLDTLLLNFKTAG